MSPNTTCRLLVFGLAFLSFACLLGQLFGFWTMRWFACWILPPATISLAVMAYLNRREPAGVGNPHTWVVQGAIGGVIAAVAYDLFRLPFVLNGAPLFKVFPAFGRLILGDTEPVWLVQLLGWTYHFSNGAALGIMLLAVMTTARPRVLFTGAVAWALVIETVLLLSPYARFFGLKMDTRFIVLTASAHLVFGLILGAWLVWKIGRAEKIVPFARL